MSKNIDAYDLVVRNVYMNMVHYLKWSDVEIVEFDGNTNGKNSNQDSIIFIKGRNTMDSTEQIPDFEYVYPIHISSKALVNEFLNELFSKIFPQKHMHLGILSNDGTVVYYKLHKGLQKPQK